MSKKEIQEQIEKLEKAIFIESMADFMNWDAYYRMRNELAKLKKMLGD